jgi:hypothetical protein
MNKILSSLILGVMVFNLIIGGILLPYRAAKAITVAEVGAMLGLKIQDVTFVQGVKFVWEKISQAMNYAKATVTAWATSWGVTDTMIKDALKFAWNRLRRMLLNMLVNDIVKWIQGGGKPRFVTDWQGFLKKAADKAVGQVIEKYAQFLCGPFSLQLQIALARVPTFDETAKCTLSDVIKNIENFYNDFASGGWKTWIKITEPQNNIYGAYLLALDERYGIEADAREIAKNEAVSGQGFLGDKICREIDEGGQITYSDTDGWKEDEIPEGAKCTKWETRTPGRIIGDSLQQATGIDIPWLISSTEFAQYAGAIIDAVINRAIREGITRLTAKDEDTSSYYRGKSVPGITTPATVSVNLSSYEDANQNGAAAKILADQQKLYKENLEKLLSEYQTNLGVLNGIKNSQLSALSILKDTLQQSCSLPPGAPQITIDSQSTPGIAESEKNITALNTEILTLQNKISQTATTYNDTVAYQQAAANYMTLYENWQRNNDKTAATSTAETIMKTAKQKVVSSNQTTLGLTSTDFNEFLKKTQDASLEAAQKNGDAQTKRGFISDCSYVQSGTLYSDLCSAQSTASSYQNSLNECIASRQNIGG